MRIFVFFDLPRNTTTEKKNANLFRKYLVKEGFLMLQESVYCKLTLNQTAMDLAKQRIRKNLPDKGNVLMLSVTEKQFASMEICCDKIFNEVIDSDKRLIIL